MLPPAIRQPPLLPSCAEFRRRNRAIYDDATIARKIDLGGANARRCAAGVP